MAKKLKVVANATPLIYLSKVDCLNILHQLFDTVYTTPEVKREVVDVGKALNKTDAHIVENAFKEGWLRVKKAPQIELHIPLQKGEETAVSLAKILKADFLLIDETRGRRAAELAEVQPLGTVGVLLLALERNLLGLQAFLDVLDRLVDVGFRLKQEIYIQIVLKARKIAEQR